MSWTITAMLAFLIGWIIFIEMKWGRRNKAFLAKTNKDINALGYNATIAYRAKFGRDPSTPFIRIDGNDSDKVSSKRS